MISVLEDGEEALRRLERESIDLVATRPEDAGHGRHRSAPAAPCGRQRRSGGGHHGARQRARRRRGDEAGGHRLPRQAADARARCAGWWPKCSSATHPTSRRRDPARRHALPGHALERQAVLNHRLFFRAERCSARRSRSARLRGAVDCWASSTRWAEAPGRGGSLQGRAPDRSGVRAREVPSHEVFQRIVSNRGTGGRIPAARRQGRWNRRAGS